MSLGTSVIPPANRAKSDNEAAEFRRVVERLLSTPPKPRLTTGKNAKAKNLRRVARKGVEPPGRG
jgi:hypothetical protein